MGRKYTGALQVLPFHTIHTVHGVLKARILKWFAIPFSSGPFCQTSPPWCVHRGWPHTAWLSFIESDKLWSMWSDWLVVCNCGFRNQRSNCQHLLDHRKSKRVPEKHLFMLYWLCQSLWLFGSQYCGKFWKRCEYQTTWPASWGICMLVRKKQLELDMEQQTGSK